MTTTQIIDRVKNFHIANMTLQKWKLNYNRVRREFWQTIATLAVVIFILSLVCGGRETTTANSDEPTSAQNETPPDDFIEQACKEYEAETGRKIYPSGRAYIRNGAIKQHLQTVNDVYILIVENSKFMWKDQINPPTITIERAALNKK
jgi:hypothetical protein